MAGYSGTPLIKKLGIKKGMRAAFISMPREVTRLLKSSPAPARSALYGKLDYIHIFVTDEKKLETGLPKAKRCLKPDGILWISWPKSGKLGTNLNENKVRDVGLFAGLVDVKVAAINDTWSGLKFVYRLKDR